MSGTFAAGPLGVVGESTPPVGDATDAPDPSAGHALGAWLNPALGDTAAAYVFFVNGNGGGGGVLCDNEASVEVDANGELMVCLNLALAREVMDARDDVEASGFPVVLVLVSARETGAEGAGVDAAVAATLDGAVAGGGGAVEGRGGMGGATGGSWVSSGVVVGSG